MTEQRFRELAEQAISYLADNGELEDFCEDREIELTKDERKYFGLVYYVSEDDVDDDELEVIEDE